MCDLLAVIEQIGNDLTDDEREAVVQLAAERVFKEACAYDILAALNRQAQSQLAKTRKYIDRRILPELALGSKK